MVADHRTRILSPGVPASFEAMERGEERREEERRGEERRGEERRGEERRREERRGEGERAVRRMKRSKKG